MSADRAWRACARGRKDGSHAHHGDYQADLWCGTTRPASVGGIMSSYLQRKSYIDALALSRAPPTYQPHRAVVIRCEIDPAVERDVADRLNGRMLISMMGADHAAIRYPIFRLQDPVELHRNRNQVASARRPRQICTCARGRDGGADGRRGNQLAVLKCGSTRPLPVGGRSSATLRIRPRNDAPARSRAPPAVQVTRVRQRMILGAVSGHANVSKPVPHPREANPSLSTVLRWLSLEGHLSRILVKHEGSSARR